MIKSLKTPDVWMRIRPYMKAEYALVVLAGAAICAALGYLFYDSWIAAVCLLPAIALLLRLYIRWKEQRDMRRYLAEFKELLYSLAANLRVGYSMENAWTAAQKELHILWPQGSALLDDMEEAAAAMRLHVPIESAVSSLAGKRGFEEVISFAEVLRTAKRSGGNLIRMMDKTSEVIAEKIETEQEIQTLLAGKRLEQRIMCGMPILMLAYLRATNPLYLEVFYHNATGILIMTVCLLGTAVAAWWGNRIVGIEV